MPRVYSIALKNESVRDVLLSAQHAMLPEKLAEQPLARWITKFGSVGFFSRAENEWQNRTLTAGDISLFGLFATAILQEACEFYFAALFHIGRLQQSAEWSLQTIARLRQESNLSASLRALSSQSRGVLPRNPEWSLNRLCDSGFAFHSFRQRSATRAWHFWLEHVAALKFLVEQIEKGPPYDWFRAADPAVTSFVVCSHLVSEYLPTAMVADQSLFMAVPSPTLHRFVDELTTCIEGFYGWLLGGQYWDRAIIQANALLSETEAKRIPRVENTPRTEEILRKLTKTFILVGKRPPIWSNVKRIADEFWVRAALGAAEVSVRFITDSFADGLLGIRTSLGRGSFPYVPLGEPSWNEHVNTFFNTHWVPELRKEKVGRLKRLLEWGGKEKKRFIGAVAFVLSAMGYKVQPTEPGELPPGIPGKHTKRYGSRRGRFNA